MKEQLPERNKPTLWVVRSQLLFLSHCSLIYAAKLWLWGWYVGKLVFRNLRLIFIPVTFPDQTVHSHSEMCGGGLQDCSNLSLHGIKPLDFEAKINFNLDTYLDIHKLAGSIKILLAFLLPEHLQKSLNLYICSKAKYTQDHSLRQNWPFLKIICVTKPTPFCICSPLQCSDFKSLIS